MTPERDDADANRENNYDEQQQQQKRSEVAYRSSSPPVPTLKNKDKKQKSATNNTRRQSYDDLNQEPSLAHLDTNDDYPQPPPPVDNTTDSHGRQTYRKPPTPRQPGLLYVLQKLAIVLCCCLCFLL
jgi:hypothetical protein